MKKSDLPVGSVVKIYGKMAVKFNDHADEGNNWRWINGDGVVEYDDVYKATWDLVSAPINMDGVKDLVKNAMGSGTAWFVDNMKTIDHSQSMVEIFDGWATDFLKYRADLVEGLQRLTC